MVEGWRKTKIRNICHSLKGKGLSKLKLDYEGKYECILYGELFTRYDEIIKKVISRTNHLEGTKSKKGDILIPGSTTTKAIDLAKASSLQKEDILLGGDINILRKIDNFYDSDFLAYYITHTQQNEISKLAQGITIIHLYGKNLLELEVNIPESIQEQSKITDILIKVDEAIEETEEIIAKQERIKTGLMQDLFTKGIDENGDIRDEKTHKFKDSPIGRIPEEWEAVVLGNNNYFTLKTGGTPSTEKREYWYNGTINWLSSGEVHKKRVHSTDGKITRLGYQCSNATHIPEKSTLIALAGQGKTRGTAAISEVELTTNQSVAAVIPNIKTVNPYYLYHYIDNQYWTLRSISAGAGRAGLSLTILSQFSIKLPKIEEQNKITLILEQIDHDIDASKNKLAKVNRIKAGLMQDLLTGRVRVTHLLKAEVA